MNWRESKIYKSKKVDNLFVKSNGKHNKHTFEGVAITDGHDYKSGYKSDKWLKDEFELIKCHAS